MIQRNDVMTEQNQQHQIGFSSKIFYFYLNKRVQSLFCWLRGHHCPVLFIQRYKIVLMYIWKETPFLLNKMLFHVRLRIKANLS